MLHIVPGTCVTMFITFRTIFGSLFSDIKQLKSVCRLSFGPLLLFLVPSKFVRKYIFWRECKWLSESSPLAEWVAVLFSCELRAFDWINLEAKLEIRQIIVVRVTISLELPWRNDEFVYCFSLLCVTEYVLRRRFSFSIRQHV